MKIAKEERKGSVVVLALSGALMGGPETSTFKEDVARLVAVGATQIVIDLGRVKWMNSSSIGIMASALRSVKEAGGDIRLARVGERVISVLVATQLEQIFRSYDNVDDAVSSFDLQVGEEMRGDVAVLTLDGAMSGGGPTQDLRDHLQEVIEAHIPRIVLDLGGVRSLSSATLGALVAAGKAAKAAGGDIRLARAGVEVAAVIANAHLDDDLASFATVDEAVAGFGSS